VRLSGHVAEEGRGITSIGLPEALEVAMCFGWVDSKMYSYDDDYCVLRYQPRRPKSTWSARNRDVAERLVVAVRNAALRFRPDRVSYRGRALGAS
jgi:uncharacterized protein YdeI (YjbR/CyaY-like superfamily)